MNFIEAVKEMRKGKKVRRPCWENKDYCLWIRFDGVIMYEWGKSIERDDKCLWYLKFDGGQIDVFCDDWIVVDEKKTLSDKTIPTNGMGYLKTKDVSESIKEFIQYIKRHITEKEMIDYEAKKIFGEELIK